MEDLCIAADVTFAKMVLEVSAPDINWYLGKGWMLFAVLKIIRDDNFPDEYALFVVGHANTN